VTSRETFDSSIRRDYVDSQSHPPVPRVTSSARPIGELRFESANGRRGRSGAAHEAVAVGRRTEKSGGEATLRLRSHERLSESDCKFFLSLHACSGAGNLRRFHGRATNSGSMTARTLLHLGDTTGRWCGFPCDFSVFFSVPSTLDSALLPLSTLLSFVKKLSLFIRQFSHGFILIPRIYYYTGCPI